MSAIGLVNNWCGKYQLAKITRIYDPFPKVLEYANKAIPINTGCILYRVTHYIYCQIKCGHVAPQKYYFTRLLILFLRYHSNMAYRKYLQEMLL